MRAPPQFFEISPPSQNPPLETPDFSLRSCRSSSVKLFGFFAGKFGGKFGGNFASFFDPLNKGSENRGKFRGIFVREFVAQIKIFCAKFTLQTCHPNKIAARNLSAAEIQCDAKGGRQKEFDYFFHSLFGHFFWRSFFRTRRIGANPEKSDLVNFRGPD